MGAKRVSINYQYFEVCAFDGENEGRYDFRNWIKKMIGLSYEQRLKDVNNISGRLEDIKLVHNEEFYALNFMRLDVISNTYIVKEDDAAQHIDLEDGEYIGRNTVALYDPRLNVLMIQSNRGSYGSVAMESYINTFNNEHELCYLRPILNDFNGDLKPNEKVMKIDVRFANTRNITVENGAFEKIIETCGKLECITAHVEFGMGYTKGETLDKETVMAMVEELRSDEVRSSVSSARIVLNDDQKTNVIDLFRNVEHDIISFTVPERGELAFDFMADKMAEKYDNGPRVKILNLLNREEE